MEYRARGVRWISSMKLQALIKLFWHRWCMTFCAFGLTHSYGVYQDYYVRVHLSNYPPSTIGWIGSFQVFLRTSGHALGLPILY